MGEQVPARYACKRRGSLRGERVLLRAFRAADRDRLEEILREPQVSRWWGGYGVDAKEIVEEIFEDGGTVAYAIEAAGELIGLIQYEEETTPDYRHAGIDIFLATAWQGRGLGGEAIRVLARHLFDERGHHRLTIDPAVANEPAIRAYKRVGFRPVGVMREYERGPDGVWRDSLLMDLLARELRGTT
jgi:aminoglycoside 6'-N-acetyltransferase